MQFTDRDEALARVYHEDAGGVLAVLISQFRDFDLAEDALQDALSDALTQWRETGPPRNGAGWLLTVARRRAIDRIRRSATAQDDANQRELLIRLEDDDADSEADQPIPDERLRLIFTCCHPALGPEAQVALTLRTLCGLSTPEIARAYPVPEATMAQRIVRAKKNPRHSHTLRGARRQGTGGATDPGARLYLPDLQ
jgi:RNA polymerase sigma-70 factor (ECF subfamily)